ncbi:hypothetical protein [Actinoplanes sp. NPDC051494]|uniref:hypothetical protein n=1 Tax=Actinoplanes sp. NPDC051494 TaxID=3363907 RepID=UPI003799414B
MVHEWRFSRADGIWECSAVPPLDENLALAIETLTDSFGTQAAPVRAYLDHWSARSVPGGLLGPVTTTSATLHPVDSRRVRLAGLYGQFTAVEIEADDVRAALHALIAEMEKSFDQHP